MHASRIAIAVSICVCSILLSGVAAAETIEVSPGDDLESVVNGLQPGDELRLADGTYELGGRFGVDLQGTADDPIVIRADDGASPLIHRPNANQNIWDLNVEHVTLRGLRFSGGSAGLRFESATNVTIEGCEIFDTADVALRMNDSGQTYENIQILRNHIHDTSGTGEGMYLGCNNDGCRLANSLIERNYVHHTNGPNVSQGDGIEIKEGSYGNVVRDNVIHDTNYPCLLLYSTVGNGDANLIERNVMWNCGDNGMQVAADATIRNNIVLGAGASGIAMQPHQNGTPDNLTVVHNTVVNSGDAIALRGATGTVVIANNAVYSDGGHAIRQQGTLDAVSLAGNVGVGGLSQGSGGLFTGDLAADFVSANYQGGPSNVFPADGGALPSSGSLNRVPELDFNGLPRNGAPDVGAYRFDADGNPGWTIAPEFKQLASPDPDPGEDAGGDAGADTGVDAGSNDASDDAGGGDTGQQDSGNSDDTGTQMDASTDEPSDTSDGSCGCSQSGTPHLPLGAATLLVAAGVVGRISRRYFRH
jgi:MYXO-CTERM domain-containing protein